MCLKAFWFFYAVIQFWLEGEGVRAWWRRTVRVRFGRQFARIIDDEITDLTNVMAERG